MKRNDVKICSLLTYAVGHKGQLAPRCRALDAMINFFIMAYKRLSTSLGSKTLNNTSSLGRGGGGGGPKSKTQL